MYQRLRPVQILQQKEGGGTETEQDRQIICNDVAG
jgi:hypothetical protein